ncbi:MAG: nitrile hydratase subunit alpha [Rhodospirillaceae bacterium]|jgi:nitrile hydratase subunit alpha|nr:nitrile hydratase subunit alpha [Rhodospirillaceae bacterium]MBT5191300.1 nitrile hydratase subunit alpha [Rhodospirillaceae bacterium]MBT5898257.1 nitrile hydratase subunit alpha [Rhodospirillaceae bacterium]MBT6431235.1 nitrile hydratase subunit alpha [Rhodospirillaceae bacterium]MBT7756850.1 nitrile hydratase subunit alpha [Rhodospirillaceae bacterium]
MTSDNDVALRVRALESLLLEKGLVEAPAIDEIIDLFENRLGPQNGAKVIARAWSDPDFKARLLANATDAIVEMGYEAVQGEDMVVVENTAQVHNIVVCTLCSCFPWATLGLPPVWYKSAPYRARAASDPRGVLAEFGTDIAAEAEVRVWDSNAELRYMVLPERPAGSESLDEEALVALVTRDSMIGVTRALNP